MTWSHWVLQEDTNTNGHKPSILCSPIIPVVITTYPDSPKYTIRPSRQMHVFISKIYSSFVASINCVDSLSLLKPATERLFIFLRDSDEF